MATKSETYVCIDVSTSLPCRFFITPVENPYKPFEACCPAQSTTDIHFEHSNLPGFICPFRMLRKGRRGPPPATKMLYSAAFLKPETTTFMEII